MSVAAPLTGSSIGNERDLQAFIATVDRAIGVQLVGKEYLIESRLQPVATTLGLDSVDAVLAAVRRGDRTAEAAAIEAMTTNETSFFRDQHPFESLAEHVLPELAERQERVTIWNGACSSGQESYTLAMSILDRVPALAMPNRTTILSTDVSPEMVARTRAASYSRFEVNRGLSTQLAIKHFDQTGRTWTAKPALRSMIDAREMNLLEPWRGVPRCDLVLLRNVLIYFTVPVRQDIFRRIRTEVLKPGGLLLLGASESPSGVDDAWAVERIGSSTFFTPKGTS
ncbi:MAG: protein-glutamate O-methyltransferase CheR [Actinomycetota bacterium]